MTRIWSFDRAVEARDTSNFCDLENKIHETDYLLTSKWPYHHHHPLYRLDTNSHAQKGRDRTLCYSCVQISYSDRNLYVYKFCVILDLAESRKFPFLYSSDCKYIWSRWHSGRSICIPVSIFGNEVSVSVKYEPCSRHPVVLIGGSFDWLYLALFNFQILEKLWEGAYYRSKFFDNLAHL